MISIHSSTDWWTTRQAASVRKRARPAVTNPVARPMTEPAHGDCRLRGADGSEIGIVVAPAQPVVLGANAPTVYLQRGEAAARGGCVEAA